MNHTSLVYARVVEELGAYLEPRLATAAFDRALAHHGVHATQLIALDVHFMLLRTLPGVLSSLVCERDLPEVLEALREALFQLVPPEDSVPFDTAPITCPLPLLTGFAS